MTATATISDAQRDANRRNAQLSTGPTSAAGKDASSRNAVRHGLAATRPTTDAEAAEHAARVASFRDLFAPVDDWQSWLVDELAGATRRVTRIARAEAAHRADAAWRAENVWDEDRQLDAENLAAGLHRRPGRTLAALRRTPHGCEWLMARWAALATAAAAGPWTAAQAELAHDLLGTPAEFRPDAAATAAQFPDPARLARAQVARLQEQAVLVDEADEAARQLVLAGLADAPTRELANLRRYERAAVRRLEWVQDQMDRAGLRPRPRSAAPAPAEPAEPSPAQPPAEVPEPTPPRATDQTKPPAAPAPASAAPEARPKRPDLAKFHRRNRRSA